MCDSSTMRTMVHGRHGVQEVSKVIPRILSHTHRNHESNVALVQVHYAGLNPVDAKGVIGDKLPKYLGTMCRRLWVEQSTIGFDFAGVVIQCPNGYYRPGDAVYGTMPPLQGTLAEYIVVPLHQMALKPASLTFAESAAMPLVGLTAVQSLSPYISPGSSILILGGSGGVGHVALGVAKALGATRIVAVCSGPKADFCRRQGATHVVDYTKGSMVEQLEQITHAVPFDVVLDCVTSNDPRDVRHGYPKLLLHDHPMVSHKYLRLGGHTFDWFRAGAERMLPVSCFGKEQLFWIRFPHSSLQLQQLQQWIDQGVLNKPHISQTVDFSAPQIQEAFDSILKTEYLRMMRCSLGRNWNDDIINLCRLNKHSKACKENGLGRSKSPLDSRYLDANTQGGTKLSGYSDIAAH